ncbi:homoserine dehydrogenase [Evansella clarkii]|uniref:homoserine dehydrogenase n=1 Tax=Evansella clarkii TaxID=79879 RepID=UPI000B45479D|nr:homoserine dehydrogenase [Evansella clarkii]
MTLKPYKIAIIGFGTVGEGVYETIEKKSEKLGSLLGRQVEVPVVLVKNGDKPRQVSRKTEITTSFDSILNKKEIDAVVEATPDAATGYPYAAALLENGVSVITANKELVAKHGEELQRLAELSGADLLYEAAVAGGIPLLNTLRHTLKINTIDKLEGILNGTSNYILTKMRTEKSPFTSALEEAQEKGYAEAVPDKDVDGWDAYYKTTILSRWIYGKSPIWQDNAPRGIRNVASEDIKLAEKAGGRLKHIASLVKRGTEVHASVTPCFLLDNHPLYNVEGVNNGINIEGSIVGSILLQGPGAGKFPTASAVVEDLVNLLKNKHELPESKGTEFLSHGLNKEAGEPSDEDNYVYFLAWEGSAAKKAALPEEAVLWQSDNEFGASAAIVHFPAESAGGLEKFQHNGGRVYPLSTNNPVHTIRADISKEEEKKRLSYI